MNNCFLCRAKLNNKFERFDVWRKKLGHYTTVTVCERCARKPQATLEQQLETKLNKSDYD